MAEAIAVFGAVASTAQLLDFTTKLANRLNHFINSVDETPATLRDITLHLPLFAETLRRTQFYIDHNRYNPTTSAMLKALIDECSSQLVFLEEILNKVTPIQDDSKTTRGRKAMCSLKHEKTITKIQSRLSGCIEKLLLFQSTVASDHVMTKIKSMQNLLEASSISNTLSPATETDRLVGDAEGLQSPGRGRKNTRRWIEIYRSGSKQYRLSSFIGLSRLGILWALQSSLNISWGMRGYSIAPTLRLQRLVKHTSPGFEIFWKCEAGVLDIPSACEDLFKLFKQEQASPLDVDPNGKTWLERILHFPIHANHEMLIAFLKMLVEWGTQMDTKELPLSLCAGWSGIGPHLTLLKVLIALGYDLSVDVCYNPSNLLPWAEPMFGFPGGYSQLSL